MDHKTNKKRYSIQQVAKQSGWSMGCIYNRILQGRLPAPDVQMLNARKYSKELFQQMVAELTEERAALVATGKVSK